MSDDLDPKALLEGTTPGPWFFDGVNVCDEASRVPVAIPFNLAEQWTKPADARLIAAAPDLAVLADRLRAERDEAVEAVHHHRVCRAFSCLTCKKIDAFLASIKAQP